MPPDDAYSRVTEPERFQEVVEAADRLVVRLLETHDVRAVPVEVDECLRAVLLAPGRDGCPLTVGISDFPGVHLVIGHRGRVLLPACGCDACDDGPDELVEQLENSVAAVVRGDVEERVVPDGYEVRIGTGSSIELLQDAQLAALVASCVPALRRYVPWSARPDPTT